MPLPTNPQLTRYEHGTGALLDGDQVLAEVRYHLVFPERACIDFCHHPSSDRLHRDKICRASVKDFPC